MKKNEIAFLFSELYRKNGWSFPKEQGIGGAWALSVDSKFEMAHSILAEMPEDYDNVYAYLAKELAQIADYLYDEVDKLPRKKPTAQELISFCGTGEYNLPSEIQEKLVYKRIPSIIPILTHVVPNEKNPEEQLKEIAAKRKEIIQKLAHSRYDLTDFADVTLNTKGKPKQVVIAASYKGKVLQVTIDSEDEYFSQIVGCLPEYQADDSEEDMRPARPPRKEEMEEAEYEFLVPSSADDNDQN